MTAPPDPYYFDEEAAARVCRFFETCLRHVEGRQFAGRPFLLLDWQRQILRDLFGWKRQDNHARRFRFAYIEIPRKAGKSAFLSGLLLYLLTADGEIGGQVYSAALNSDQSGITFRAARRMVKMAPVLAKRVRVKVYSLEDVATGSIYKALSGESLGSHGKGISGLGIDELHEWRTPQSRELWEALLSSRGAREQPLTVAITTAGLAGEETLYHEQHNKALAYMAGTCDDPEFYGVVHGLGSAEDWRDPENWRKANPSIGHTVPLAYYEAEYQKTKSEPSYENTFRRLYLNQIVEQTTRWLALDAWDACAADIDPEDLRGRPCIVGLDLSQSYDLTAIVAIYPGPDKWLLVPRLYCPGETAQRRQRDDGIPYLDWIRDGHVIATDGPTIDYNRIEADIHDLARTSRVLEVGFDPYNATAIVGKLDAAGIATVPVRQGYLDMSRACKELERRLLAKSIAIQRNPCLRWMAANVEIESDRHGNIRPTKPRAKGRYAGTAKLKVDGITASVIGLSRAMLQPDTAAPTSLAVWL